MIGSVHFDTLCYICNALRLLATGIAKQKMSLNITSISVNKCECMWQHNVSFPHTKSVVTSPYHDCQYQYSALGLNWVKTSAYQSAYSYSIYD